jgi:hypothetical protein
VPVESGAERGHGPLGVIGRLDPAHDSHEFLDGLKAIERLNHAGHVQCHVFMYQNIAKPGKPFQLEEPESVRPW